MRTIFLEQMVRTGNILPLQEKHGSQRQGLPAFLVATTRALQSIAAVVRPSSYLSHPQRKAGPCRFRLSNAPTHWRI